MPSAWAALRRDGGREVPTGQVPPDGLAKAIATCALSLPIELCGIETIEELERRSDFPAWQASPRLGGELVLVLDEHGEAELHGHRLRYERADGLVVTRLDATPGVGGDQRGNPGWARRMAGMVRSTYGQDDGLSAG